MDRNVWMNMVGGGGNIQQWMEAATNERANEQTNEQVIGWMNESLSLEFSGYI